MAERKYLRLKASIIFVLFAAWVGLFSYSMNALWGFEELGKKQLRQVVMLDAWSYSSGNSREKYEARFQDHASGKEFVYGIDSLTYHVFIKTFAPKETELMLSDTAVGLQPNNEGNIVIVAAMTVFLALAGGFLAIVIAAYSAHRRGWVYEIIMGFKDWNEARKK